VGFEGLREGEVLGSNYWTWETGIRVIGAWRLMRNRYRGIMIGMTGWDMK